MILLKTGMKKSFKISFFIFIIIVLGSAFFIYQQNNKTDLSYQIGKLD